MHPDEYARRSRVNLAIAMGITALVGIISVCINMLDSLHRFFSTHSQMRLAHWLLNGLFFWLLFLLALAYWRWRQSEKSREQLKVVLDGINPDTLLVVSPERTILMSNPTITPMFGYRQEEVLHRGTDLLYQDRRTDPARPREIYEALQRKGYHIGGAVGLRSDGRQFPMEVITGELGRCAGAVLLLRDITDRVHEDKRRHQTEEQMRRWQYLESLGVLAGGVAHDFNNILTGVLGNADLALNTGTVPVEVRRNLEEIVASAQRAARICRELLTYAGQMRPRLETLDLATALEREAKTLQTLVPPHIELRWECGTPAETLRADPHQFRQLLQNLVSNACEAIGTQPGVIIVRAGRRQCDAEFLRHTQGAPHPAPGPYVFVSVADTGEGISPADVERIFEPFFSTRFPGRGLGLASALGIARGHHGVLHVASSIPEGTIFTVLMPAAAPERGQEA